MSAAGIMFARRRSASSAKSSHQHETAADVDGDDELMAVIKHDGSKRSKGTKEATLRDGPLNVSHDTLIGKMPKADKVLKNSIMQKLTSTYEWKPVNMSLTAVGLFLSRPGEDVLRDLIPLYEIIEIKKRSSLEHDDESGSNQSQGNGKDSLLPTAGPIRRLRTIQMSSLVKEEHSKESAPLYIIQVRTAEDGYNSGRTYFFCADSDELCSEWMSRLRTETDRAVLLRHAGPSVLKKLRYHLQHFYHGAVFQGVVAVLIVCSFLVNIAQTELVRPEQDSGPVFAALEYFFTLTFALELVLNMVAHFFWPFFAVPPPALIHIHMYTYYMYTYYTP
jgi:hypothetical protein